MRSEKGAEKAGSPMVHAKTRRRERIVPRLARRDPDSVFGGWKGPPSCRCLPRETRKVSCEPSTLCVLCVLCGSNRGGAGGAHQALVLSLGGGRPLILPRPGGRRGGRWEGITAENAADAEGLRVMSVVPRLARRDPDSVFGGWKGPHPADACRARRGACRGSRQPSASSVFSVVQSGVGWGHRGGREGRARRLTGHAAGRQEAIGAAR